jgi:glycosyltransferase involved in cell wall biosynthesis
MGIAYSTLRADPGLEPMLEQAVTHGWKTFQLEMVRSISPMQDMQSVARVRKLVLNYTPDVLHCHSSKAGAIGRIAIQGLERRPRLVYSPHAISANLGIQYLIAERLLSHFTDRFAAVSDSERDEIVSYGLTSIDRVDVVYPVIDTNEYFPLDRNTARQHLGLPFDCKLMLGIGRLTKQKDPLKFVEVARLVSLKEKAFKAVWLGDGELRREMQIDIEKKGLGETVILAGWQKDVRPWLASSDLLLSTSVYESFGYMVAEALAMERPVVASSISGTCDIMIRELKELLYRPNDVISASKLATDLLNSPFRALSLGQCGRKIVEQRFSADRMRESLSACYRLL